MAYRVKSRPAESGCVADIASILFTSLGFLLIGGISHSDEYHGGGKIVAGVVLLLPWFAAESAINSVLSGSQGSSTVSLLTTGVGLFGQFLYYLAIYWLLKRLFFLVRPSGGR